MTNFWYIGKDFYTERSGRIGASDIPALIPNPEKPTETLAGYGRTPVTVYQEKVGEKVRDPAGLPAEMGHWNEAKAAEWFIRQFDSYETGRQHVRDRLLAELEPEVSKASLQNTAFHHNAQWYGDGMIVHPDVVYIPPESETRKRQHGMGLTVDLTKPFIIECKNANYWAAKRRPGSVVSGYDFDLHTWQGIPLKHYMQIQFQMNRLQIPLAYLSLIYNTSQWYVWEIRANRKHQAQLLDIAGKMVWHIENRVPPKDLAMNKQDIIDLYPEVDDDFVLLSGDAAEKARQWQEKRTKAAEQEKVWGERKKDAEDALAAMMGSSGEIRDDEGRIAKWICPKPSLRLPGLKQIEKDNPVEYRYLQRKGLIKEVEATRRLQIDKVEIGEE